MGDNRGQAWLGLGDGKSSKNPPPATDWLRAIIFDRIESIGDRKEAAALCGFKYDSFRKLLKKSPLEWKEEQRQAVKNGLRISQKDYLEAWAKYAQ